MSHETYFQLRERYLRGEISCREQVEQSLERIVQYQHLNAFITVTEDLARQQALECDRYFRDQCPRPLEGMIVAIKDNISIRAIRTTCASRILANFVPVYDATVVKLLRNAGAIIIGKTNLDEFAMGSSTETSFWGPARNPYKDDFVAGGSSGGSAIAVATGMVHVALGSDTGGSIRQPAAFCGVIGFKPSYGRVSRYGLVAFASSLDQIGPFARSMRDLIATTHIISGPDAHDSTSSPLSSITETLEPYSDGESRPILGTVGPDILDGCTEEIRQAYKYTCMLAKELGYQFIDIDFYSSKAWIPAYYILATAEASSNLARYDGVRYCYRVDDNDDILTATRTNGFGLEVKRRIMLGTYVLSAGYYDAYYRTAQQARRWIVNNYTDIFRRCDAILLPTTPTPPFRLGEKISDPLAMYLNDLLTVSANLAGTPAISLPAGTTKEGLPIGMQLQAAQNNDELLLRIASDLERALRKAPFNALAQ